MGLTGYLLPNVSLVFIPYFSARRTGWSSGVWVVVLVYDVVKGNGTSI